MDKKFEEKMEKIYARRYAKRKLRDILATLKCILYTMIFIIFFPISIVVYACEGMVVCIGNYIYAVIRYKTLWNFLWKDARGVDDEEDLKSYMKTIYGMTVFKAAKRINDSRKSVEEFLEEL